MPARPDSGRAVLVLDGETRKALAVVRSLGRRGIFLIVASDCEGAIARRSRFTSESIHCPNAKSEPAAFQRWLLAFVEERRPHMVLPLTDRTVTQVLSLENLLRSKTILPFVSNETFLAVADKGNLIRTAKTLDIGTPETVEVRGDHPPSAEDAELVRNFRYPGVLKPRQSESQQGERFRKVAVEYVAEPIHTLETLSRNPGIPFLLQERIEGDGVGVFALCHRGEALQIF